MALPTVSSHDWTIEKLHALPDDGNRYEIIDGVLYVTPAPRPIHQWALHVLLDLVQPYARARGLEGMCLPADVAFSDRVVVQPDLYVFSKAAGSSIREWSDIQPLELVVEVLSPSSRRYDRTVKRDLYRQQGIPEYWIVDIDARIIERWRPSSPHCERHATVFHWQPVATHPPLQINVVQYFRTVHGD